MIAQFVILKYSKNLLNNIDHQNYTRINYGFHIIRLRIYDSTEANRACMEYEIK